jgi:hypothetical protein
VRDKRPRAVAHLGSRQIKRDRPEPRASFSLAVYSGRDYRGYVLLLQDGMFLAFDAIHRVLGDFFEAASAYPAVEEARR